MALLNGWFWPEVQRGSERILHDLAVDLLALGHQPRLITSHPGATTRTVEEGLPITRLRRLPDVPLRKRNVQESLTHLPFAYRELLIGDDDIAHPVYFTDALAALEWRKRTGKPVVHTYMGIPQRNVISNKRLRMKILERVTTESDAVVVLSKAARDGMWRWLGVESELIYPGIDLDLFTPDATQRAEQPTIACAADVADGRKRVDLLVKAFARVRREKPTARLLLMRPKDARVAEQVEDDGVEFFTPDPRAVADVYREAWVTGLASYNEAFGLVLVESLASGTPVFARRDGGPAEIVDRPEVGRLFDGDDEAEVAKAILETLELASDPATAGRCRERAEDFSTMASAEQYVALYERLLAS